MVRFSIAVLPGKLHFRDEDHQPFNRETTMSYQTPRLEVFGRVEDLTRVAGDQTQTDAIFLNGTLIPGSEAQGSLDACVSTDPRVPSGTCDVPTP